MARTWTNQKQAQSVAATNLPAATETVLVTVGGISTPSADAVVNLEAVAQLIYPAGATTVTLRVRRGTDATGTLVGAAVAENVVASTTGDLEIQVQDTPGEVASQSYVLTATSAVGAGTNAQSSLQANY